MRTAVWNHMALYALWVKAYLYKVSKNTHISQPMQLTGTLFAYSGQNAVYLSVHVTTPILHGLVTVTIFGGMVSAPI